MLIDELQPRFDAIRAEHMVVPGEPEDVYEVVLQADFIEAWRGNLAVRILFALRAFAERAVTRVLGRELPPEPEVESLRLADMPEHGDWVRLGSDPSHEVVFGVIGRFWGGETVWEQIDASDFAGFDRPGFAKIACNFSLRPYGPGRTLVSYEVRTMATDAAARKAFLRYWRVTSPLIGVVMRSLLSVARRDAGLRARSAR